MDPTTQTVLVASLFVLVTLPLLIVCQRLTRLIRIMGRIEAMNLRSLQRWN